MKRMSEPKPVKTPAPLMELDLSPPDGYPKLRKWDSTLKYRLKDPYLINEFENSFLIDSDLSNRDEETKIIDGAKRKQIAEVLPKCALPPPHRVEETEKYLNKSHTRSEKKLSGSQAARDQEVPIRYTKMSESSESTNSGSSDSYFDAYLEIKKAKALLLKKIREDGLKSFKSLSSEESEILDQADFMLEKNSVKIESFSLSDDRFRNQSLSRTTENETFRNDDLNSLTKELKEYFI